MTGMPLADRVRYSRPVRWWKKHIIWSIEDWLLAWTLDVEPCSDYDAKLLAEDDNGDWLVPSRTQPNWWQGYWHWWRPDHWPVYLRSRRRRAYVMVEAA